MTNTEPVRHSTLAARAPKSVTTSAPAHPGKAGAATTIAPPRLPSLTGLRFPAAFLVFLYHASVLIPTIAVFGYGSVGTRYARVVRDTGAIGVMFFFVLSGFVLTWSARWEDSAGAFLRRRLVKIYPNYVVAWVLAMVALAAATTSAGVATLHLFMLQAWVPDFFTNFGVNPPGWSLGAEAFFYAAFPLVLGGVRRIPAHQLRYWIGATVLAIFAMPLVAYTFMSESPRVPGGLLASPLQYWLVYVFPPVRLLDFVLGILVARAVITGRWRDIGLVPAGLLMLVGYGVAQAVPYLYAQSAVTVVPTVLLIAAAASADAAGKATGFGGPVARWLGDRSFAFYLLHFIVLVEVVKWARSITSTQAFSPLGGVLVLACVVVVTLILSAVLYTVVERPLTRRWSSRRKPPAAAQADVREMHPVHA